MNDRSAGWWTARFIILWDSGRSRVGRPSPGGPGQSVLATQSLMSVILRREAAVMSGVRSVMAPAQQGRGIEWPIPATSEGDIMTQLQLTSDQPPPAADGLKLVHPVML